MNVRDEIDRWAAEQDKAALLWLLGRYPRESQWSFVAKCRHVRYGKMSYQTYREWGPTPEGLTLYRAWHT